MVFKLGGLLKVIRGVEGKIWEVDLCLERMGYKSFNIFCRT